MVVKCSRKTCTRTHTTKFKLCPTCRENISKSKRKRKRLAEQQTIPIGKRCCTNCCRIQNENEFHSLHARRTTFTAWCRTCRDVKSRSQKNPTTTTGKCRQVWMKWRNSQVCVHCGDTSHIEADHLRDKVRMCSEYTWWACHGGTEALTKELTKCQPLCLFCHRLKSEKERKPQTRPSKVRKRAIINAEKMRAGGCERCDRKCTPENLVAFDWAHNDRKTKTIHISRLVYKAEAYFQAQWPIERAKCNLLCCLCHKDETIEENKRN